jgi:hypothetical protein
VLDLVQQARGTTRADALRFVADVAGFALRDRPATRTQARAAAEQRRAAEITAKDIEYWRGALIHELDQSKLAAAAANDIGALASAASLLCRLTNGPPAQSVSAYLSARHDDPTETARLIAAGRAQALAAERVAARLVLLLAAAQSTDDTAQREAESLCDALDLLAEAEEQRLNHWRTPSHAG